MSLWLIFRKKSKWINNAEYAIQKTVSKAIDSVERIIFGAPKAKKKNVIHHKKVKKYQVNKGVKSFDVELDEDVYTFGEKAEAAITIKIKD